MKKRLLALILSMCLLMTSCAGSKDELDFPTELKEDNQILGTVFGEDITYTDYRLYLDLEDRAYRDTLRLEMALNGFLETKLAEEGSPVTKEAFEEFAADVYYKEMISYPNLIDEIDSAEKLTGLSSDEMDMALFETYRQGYYIEQLGDIFYAEYQASNSKPDDMSDEDYANASYSYANAQLETVASELYEKVTLSEKDDVLCVIDGEEIKMEERHKAYMVLAAARNRLNAVNAILIGIGMAKSIENDGKTIDLTDIEKGYRDYLVKMSKEKDFTEFYGKHLESLGATMGQLLESTYRAFEAMGAYSEEYMNHLAEKYENLDAADKPETFEEYYSNEYEALCAECLSVNPLG